MTRKKQKTIEDSHLDSGRTIFVNNWHQTKQEHGNISSSSASKNSHFPDGSNSVRSSKYTVINFIPKNLFEQFRRIANLYFLMISLLQLCTNLSPTNEYSTVGPLTMVILATMVKEIIEDKARHDADYVVNKSLTHVYRKDSFIDVPWENVRVSDLILVKEGESLPCDIVLLSSSNTDGSVQLEASGLDGESNLKTRQSLNTSHILFNDRDSPLNKGDIIGQIRCENPNSCLFQFNGVLRLYPTGGETTIDSEVTIGIDHVVLRGMVLVNTEWLIGAAVYVGRDTKLMLNSKSIPSKFSRLDRVANKCITLIFSLLFVLCTTGTILSSKWTHELSHKPGTISYLPFTKEFRMADFPNIWVTYLILYNNLVPISLYICLEVVKWYQAKQMENDSEMKCEKTGQGIIARTSNLNEDVGQISYVFTDKTGTLTKNEMSFRACTIGGVIYDGKKMASRKDSSVDIKEDQQTSTRHTTRSRMCVKDILPYTQLPLKALDSENPNEAMEIKDSLRCILLCNTATLNKNKLNGNFDEIKASSPDEGALLSAVKEFNNSRIISRTKETIEIDVLGNTETYRIIALIEFDSNRKCMSILVEREDGSKVLYCKGADTALIENSKMNCILRSKKNANLKAAEKSNGGEKLEKAENIYQGMNEQEFQKMKALETTKQQKLTLHIHYFASMGLRTLVLAKREISETYFDSWFSDYDFARKRIVSREKCISDAAREIESNLHILGATGVEDRLQRDVNPCIEALRNGGINIWMLTGDKDETAMSIANSCGLINSRSRMVIVNAKNKQDCLDQIMVYRRKLKKEGTWCPGVVNSNLGLLINGEALHCLLSNESASNSTTHRGSVEYHGSTASISEVNGGSGIGNAMFADTISSTNPSTAVFLDIVTQCISVVACRLSPLQKAQIISMIKNSRKKPMTLAVGDGGNDVSMIQEAHIGIGIFGHEGMQAVRAADFAMPEFCFLSRMILVHGRWNYKRVAIVILFSFYKNIVLILTLFGFSFKNGYSGQTLYESYLMVGWNVFYTLMPIFILGIFDEDITAETVLRYPFVFRSNHKSTEFNMTKMSYWIANAILHSILTYTISMNVFEWITSTSPPSEDGLFLHGTAVYGTLVFTVNMKAALTMQPMHRWTRLHYFSIIGSISLYFIFVAVYSQAYYFFPHMTFFGDFNGIGPQLFTQFAFWFTIPMVAAASLMTDVAIIYVCKMYIPTSGDIISEIDSGFGPISQNRVSGSQRPTLKRSHSRKRLASLTGHMPEWGSRFNDQDAITEHEELSRQLIAYERDVAREMGKIDPVLQKEHRESTHAVAADPATHPLTMEFVGEINEKLEQEYIAGFVTREVRRIQVCVKILSMLIPPYAMFEVFVERETINLKIRLIMFIFAVFYLRFSYTKTFAKYYDACVLIPLALSGMGFTLTITATGKFAITAFPIVVFAVIRIRFFHAILLALFNFTFYLMADEMGFKRDNSYSPPIEDILMFVVYMIFVIIFAAFSCYKLQMAMRKDFLQNRSLVMEQQRSTDILSHMLPPHVTKRLQEGQTLICDEENDVTVLFCDIVDFKAFTSRFTPTELVSLLDRIYSLFDEICMKYNVQKMETVGKTYMACAGLGNMKGPNSTLNNQSAEAALSALRAASMAIEMLSIIGKMHCENGNGIKLRIGIHSGRVISGLVGMKKQQFSLFGDTVNTASRMQSTGVTGKCQVSQATYEKLKVDFSFTKRSIQVKGKGLMTAYLLEDPITQLAFNACHGQFIQATKSAGLQQPRASSVVFPRLNLKITSKTSKYFSKSKNKLVRNCTKWDPCRIFFGTFNVEAQMEEMQSEIHNFTLIFKNKQMESSFQRSTLFNRIQGSQRILWVLNFYMLYGILRDLFMFFTDPYGHQRAFHDQHSHAEIHAMFLILPRLPFILISSVCIFCTNKTNLTIFKQGFGIVDNTLSRCISWKVLNHDSHLKLMYFLILFAAFSLVIPHVESFMTHSNDVSVYFSDMCLDILFLMFMTSNGGGLVHKHSMILNALILAFPLIICVFLSYYNLNFPFYPLVLSFFTGIANMVASRGVEFFTRRKVWLHTRTQHETRKADQLLYQMLPQEVVGKLKEGGDVCDQHHSVGILFSDIKGFTTIASRADTDQVVNLLNSLFSAFDKLTEKHGVFKLQTIGDAYVIVSGLPYTDLSLSMCSTAENLQRNLSQNCNSPLSKKETSTLSKKEKSTVSPAKIVSTRKSYSPHNVAPATGTHLRNLIGMASDMHKEVRKLNDPITGERLQMRIGIHVGSIIGGVIGTTTLRYDMWGPDVLTANELESNGVPEKTLVSEGVHRFLCSIKDVKSEFHEEVNFTGIARMKTYLVEIDNEQTQKSK